MAYIQEGWGEFNKLAHIIVELRRMANPIPAGIKGRVIVHLEGNPLAELSLL